MQIVEKHIVNNSPELLKFNAIKPNRFDLNKLCKNLPEYKGLKSKVARGIFQ